MTPSASQPFDHLRLELIHPDQVQPHPDNPRKHPRKQVQQIAKSIKELGFRFPVLIDAQSRLIAGHGRIEAAKLLALKEVPAVRADDLTDAQARALMIADNRLTEISDWDETLLAQNLKMLSDLEIDFDLDVIGFEYGEIENRISQLELVDDGEADTADDIPEFEQSQSICQVGDVWQLGDHRLICGDSTQVETYQSLLGDERASLVFTDPPYNMPARDIGQVCASQHGEFAMGSGEMSPEQFTTFLGLVMALLCRFSLAGSIHYLFMDWRHASEMLAAGSEHYSAFKNLCVWVKDRPGMGTYYRSQHELVFVFKHGNSSHQNNFKLGQFGRTRSNVWHFPSVRQFSAEDGDPDGNEALKLHPTVKPVKLIEEALLDCSRRSEIVVDPFLGSGSTLIACDKVQRRCFGIEIDPRYADVTIQRWQQWTGLEAIHDSTGRTYGETASLMNLEADHG
ncbi:MAG: DNA methyltransferase [Planctomycetota bacterium]